MKKLTWLFAFIFSLTSIVGLAQPPQQMPVEDRVKRTIDRLKPELTLTDKQITEITPVYTEYYTEMDKLRAAGNPTPEDRQKLSATRDEKLKKSLSEEQMKKLKELEEQMRQQRRQGGPPQK